MPIEAVSQCKKSINATALQEKAKGKKANKAPRCRKIKKPVIPLLNMSLGFTRDKVGMNGCFQLNCAKLV
jgi:hypothetical protein